MSVAENKAVFLSYASQDAEAARRICETLRASEVEVWFDQSELVGGDAWDTKIRKQIKQCALFVPIISAHTQARLEGYFRIEWKLAAQRTHAMAAAKSFLMPVVLDDTRDAEAHVPEEFLAVQWTRLDGEGALEKFGARVKKLLSGDATAAPAGEATVTVALPTTAAWRSPSRMLALLSAAALVALALWQPWRKPSAGTNPERGTTAIGERTVAPAPETAASLAAKAFEHYYPFCTPGRLQLADDFARRATELDLNYARGWGTRAGASARYLLRDWVSGEVARQRARDAQSFAHRALSLDKNDTEALLALGIVAWHQHATSQAETLFRRVLTIDPANVQAPALLSRIARESGHATQAVELMKGAVNRAPRDPMVRLYLGFAYFDGWNFRKASEQFAIASRVADFQGATVYKAWSDFFNGGELAHMRAALDQLDLVYSEDDGKLAINLVCGLFERRCDRVVETAGRSATAYIDDWWTPKAWFVALAYEMDRKDHLARQQWQAAEAVVRERLRADPQDETLRMNLAITLAKLGHGEEARVEFEPIAAVWREQMTPIRARRLARFYAASGDATNAVAWLRQCVNRPTFLDENETPRTLELDPWWDGIRPTEEFRALLAHPPPPPVPVDEPAPPKANATAVHPPEKSVAVLPFANLSTERENEFFAEGIHDDVITNLQKIRDLKVISRTSVLAYRDSSARNLATIARELGVATVVEGSVRRVGTQVKVNAKLIHARSEASLWTDSLLGDASDLFGLQATMAQKIAAALKATLTEGERTLIERRPTKSPVAYELFLKARRLHDALNNRSSRTEHETAIAAYQRVLVEDPDFALVHCRLAHVHGHMYWLGHLDPTPARRALAQAALREAMRIDPRAPETEYAQGLVAYYCEMDWSRALTHYQQAELRLPNDAALQGQLGFTHRRLGHWNDYLRHFERAIELEPRYLYLGSELSASFLEHRRPEAARDLAERFAAIFPDDALIANTRARADFALTGDRAAFLAALERLPRAGQDPTGLRAAYDRAMWAHDLAAAERILADRALGSVIDAVSIIEAPVALHRALVAFLQGKSEDARNFSAAAMTEYARRSWTPRQEPFVALDIAAAKAYAGRGDEAVREAQSAIAATEKMDVYAGAFARLLAGRIFAAMGRKEEALTLLRQLMGGVSRLTPNEIRLDPCWSRLQHDPRFEEILKSAKPL